MFFYAHRFKKPKSSLAGKHVEKRRLLDISCDASIFRSVDQGPARQKDWVGNFQYGDKTFKRSEIFFFFLKIAIKLLTITRLGEIYQLLQSLL